MCHQPVADPAHGIAKSKIDHIIMKSSYLANAGGAANYTQEVLDTPLPNCPSPHFILAVKIDNTGSPGGELMNVLWGKSDGGDTGTEIRITSGSRLQASHATVTIGNSW